MRRWSHSVVSCFLLVFCGFWKGNLGRPMSLQMLIRRSNDKKSIGIDGEKVAQLEMLLLVALLERDLGRSGGPMKAVQLISLRSASHHRL